MKYSIPTNKLEKLEKIIKKYQKKGADITFAIGNKVTEKGTLFINDAIHHVSHSVSIDVECYEVEVEGSYVISGWQFVGTIEFTENGNIIRLANSAYEGLVPAKYLHTSKICEHCGTIRNRKDTYLIMSDEGEFKQVGSSCLLEYTRGLDANTCASIMSCLDQVREISNKDCDFETFRGNGFSSTGFGVGNTEALKALAIGLVKKQGYTKMQDGIGTASDLSNLFFHNLPSDIEEQLFGDVTPASEEEVKAIDEYAKDYFESNNEYMRNASLAWSRKSIEFRDFGLIASFAHTYLKDMQKRQEMSTTRVNEHVGNIGDRITFKVAFARVLFVKDNSMYSYYASASKVWEIVDTEGHTFKWSASFSTEIKPNDTITATIKDHTEYKSVKQTVITRGKVISD